MILKCWSEDSKLTYCIDVVIWDSHPLALGATPKQVFIDGIAQLISPHNVEKPPSAQRAPKTPDYDKEAANAVKYEGLPPLEPLKTRGGIVVFTNVSNVWLRSPDDTIYDAFEAHSNSGQGVAVVQNGRILCQGMGSDCATLLTGGHETMDLHAGALQPGLVTVGSSLGIQDIAMESSTTDGIVYNLLAGDAPVIAGGAGYVPKAADGLMYGTRDAL